MAKKWEQNLEKEVTLSKRRGILGSGSFGTVFQGKKKGDNTPVAVKVSNFAEDAEKEDDEYASSLMKQAKQEAELLFMLKSKPDSRKYVVQIMCSLQLDKFCLCVVLELLQGNLKFVIEQQKLSLDQIKYLSRQLLEALQFLKKYRVVHADLKPENILVRDEPGNQRWLICDLGLSFQEGQPSQETIVTPWYRAPECFLGGKRTCSLDVWSLGCILYEIWHRQPLFGVGEDKELFTEMTKYFDIPPNYDAICPRLGYFSRYEWREKKVSFRKISHKSGQNDFWLNTLIRRMLDLNPMDRLTPICGLELLDNKPQQHVGRKRGGGFSGRSHKSAWQKKPKRAAKVGTSDVVGT